MTTTPDSAHAPQIRKATAGDIPRIATTLARAFFDDPVFRWTYPDHARRRELLPRFFTLFTEMLERHDETHVAERGGAALWAPPGQAPVAHEQADDFGRRLTELSGADAERLVATSKLLEQHHPPGSYYFLQFIGVEPASQGRGIGSALLAPVLERCDRERTLAYLDATSPRNKQLYERHGFRAGEPFAVADGPPLWPMWREPGARTA